MFSITNEDDNINKIFAIWFASKSELLEFTKMFNRRLNIKSNSINNKSIIKLLQSAKPLKDDVNHSTILIDLFSKMHSLDSSKIEPWDKSQFINRLNSALQVLSVI